MSGHIQWRWQDPYSAITGSQVTSQIIDLRDAVAWTASWYTTSGSTSVVTLQVSNCSVDSAESSGIANNTFVNYQTFGTGSPAMIVGDPAVRYGRCLRTPSGASISIDVNKQVA